jgi:hypothetical protein
MNPALQVQLLTLEEPWGEELLAMQEYVLPPKQNEPGVQGMHRLPLDRVPSLQAQGQLVLVVPGPM